MAQEEEKAFANQPEEAPQPQAEEGADLAVELDDEALDEVSGGYRVRGGQVYLAEGERDYLICKKSKNPFMKHKWQQTGTTKCWNGVAYQDVMNYKCIWCGHETSRYL